MSDAVKQQNGITAARIEAIKELESMFVHERNRTFFLKEELATKIVHVFESHDPYISMCEVDFKDEAQHSLIRKIDTVVGSEDVVSDFYQFSSTICPVCRNVVEASMLATRDISILEEWYNLEKVLMTDGLI